ncbi:hypothetical protein [Streptomyces sp. SID3343]|uniref:hypothetical protein n=1 Tax=Streptomyces sp. SID3343 TaxID=2690260 RepID=UPI00137136BB|nr:hypothetical protein [Streptomyces sp. SID3343]MYW01385.1 hypothetical protein [Streptomyces sp. SID3343]
MPVMGDATTRIQDGGGTGSTRWQGYEIGTRVRVQVGLSIDQVGEVCEVFADAHRPPLSPYQWYTVRFADGLRPLYRHDELVAVH